MPETPPKSTMPHPTEIPVGFTPDRYGTLIMEELLRMVRQDRERLEATIAEAKMIGAERLGAAVRRADHLMNRLEQLRDCLCVFRSEAKKRHPRVACLKRTFCPVCEALKKADEILREFRWE